MPVVPNNISDLFFEERDLYLDVRLTTISNEGTVVTDPDTGLIQSSVEDFTGKPTFNVGFFREQTGFGITNIKVETNTSLQPIVEIEFKDLFGKTVFGELSDVDTGINYAALFQWPPPKFVFTFKGYLGSPVTWLLNMKTTSTQYNSDDGSYTIKATFVPNQWGMFSDIPFLYLYAAKKLRADVLGSNVSKDDPEYIKATESIIDLMYIGKSIEVETKNVTKEYDEVINKLETLKRDPVVGITSGVFGYKKKNEIKSAIPGRGELPGFKPITINKGGSLEKADKAYKSDPDILFPVLKNLNANLRNVENYKIKISAGQSVSPSIKTIKAPIGKIPRPADLEALKREARKVNDVIDENIEIIDKGIKGALFNEKKDELKKLTISSVFSRIARDAAYIMGYIIDAGEQGYLNNIVERNRAEKGKTIGKYYPMIFEKKEGSDNQDLGKQVPAKGLGTAPFEKKFVSDFITAISFGIAQNRALQAEAAAGADTKIKHIINNLELGTENPFIGINDWSMIASIILKRAGIAGFLTQSFIPALPGNMEPNGDTEFTFADYKKIYDNERIRGLANNDGANLTDTILQQLDVDGLEKLKEFCIVMEAFIGKNSDGTDARRWGSLAFGSSIIINPGLEALAPSSTSRAVVRRLTNAVNQGNRWVGFTDTKSVFGGAYNGRINAIDFTTPFGKELRTAGVVAYTFEDFMGNFIGVEKFFFGHTTRQKANGEYTPPTWGNGVSFERCMGNWAGMNGAVFAHTCHNSGYGKGGKGNGVEYVVFSDPADIARVGEALDAPQASPRSEDNDEGQSDSEEVDEDISKIVRLGNNLVPEDPEEPTGDKIVNQFLEFYNLTLAGERASGTELSLLNYSKVKDVDFKTKRDVYYNPATFTWRQYFGPTPEDLLEDGNAAARGSFWNVNTRPVIIAPYAQYPSKGEGRANLVPIACGLQAMGGSTPYGSTSAGRGRNFVSDDDEYYMSLFTLAFLREYVLNLKPKIQKILDETDKIFGAILGKAGESEDLIYQQMHTLFHQWQILGSEADGSRINQPGNPSTLEPNVALRLQETYGKNLSGGRGTPRLRERSDGNTLGGGFRYDYPLQAIGANEIKVEDSLISLEPLYKAKANTTVLNAFQQLCSKNNFMFFPICGNARYNKVTDIFAPQEMMGPRVGNFFQVMFQPTPESRTLQSNNTDVKQSATKDLRDFKVDAFPVAFGDPTNKIIKNVQVSTDENKVTAESIVNLQAIVDNENKNRTVTTDCSLLSVFEGRSYKAGIETLGNAQISPMQFFYLENHTIFTGLYQIIKVSHKISPNDMTTDLTGIKMRYGGDSYGGITPITYADFEEAGAFIKNAPNEKPSEPSAASRAQVAAGQAANEVNFPNDPNGGSSSDGGGGGGAGSNYKVTGTDKGSKAVQGYLRSKTKKRRIDKIIKECVRRGITSDFAIAAILGICSKESSFDLKAEGFNYSAGRMPEVWGYFKRVDPVKNGFVNPKTLQADSRKYQEKIANTVYTQKPVGIRENGYGNTQKGDGWKYRGRGYNQTTFKSGYEKSSKDSGLDLVKNPDLLLQEDPATKAMVGFMNRRRQVSRFGNEKSGYTTPQDGYGTSDKGVTFPSLKNAVFFYYHLNTGPGKSVASIKKKLSPDEKLGGMRRAQSRAPAFVEYIKANFQNAGITFLKDKG